MRHPAAVVCLVLALAALPAAAQEAAPMEPLTAIAHFKVAPAQGDAWVDWMLSTYGDTLAELEAEGTILSWGVVSTLFHADMDSTHSAYFTVPDYAAMEAVHEALDARDAALDEEDQEAMMKVWSGVDIDAHHDELVRHVRFADGGSDGGGEYISLGTHQAKPGSGAAALELFDRLVRPVYDALVEEGHVLAYGVYVPELHMGETATHTGWAVLPDMAAMDAVSAAFEEAEAAWTPADYEQLAAAFDRSAHRDVILRIHHADGEGE